MAVNSPSTTVLYSKGNLTATVSGNFTCSDDIHSHPSDPWKAVHWCEHIRDLIVNNEDVDWVTIPDAEQVEKYLSIPMFPSYSLWTKVRLYPVHDRRIWEVFWDECPTSNKPVFITNLNEYEGRNVIRLSLINYMIGDNKRTELCKDSAHGFQAQTEWDNAIADPVLRLVQQWSVYMSDKCLYCLLNSDFSHAIPEAEGSPWSK